MRGSIVYCLLIALFGALWYEASPLETPEGLPLAESNFNSPSVPIPRHPGNALPHPHLRYAAMLKSASNQPAR
jgi:hypothetical protein